MLEPGDILEAECLFSGVGGFKGPCRAININPKPKPRLIEVATIGIEVPSNHVDIGCKGGLRLDTHTHRHMLTTIDIMQVQGLGFSV